MKQINLYLPPSRELIRAVEQRRGWKLEKKTGRKLLQEDYSSQSKRHPVFSVTDGVTLVIKTGAQYPYVSGAAKVAEIVCKNIVKNAEKVYSKFNSKSVSQIFQLANLEAKKYNEKRGRKKQTINYFDRDYFCTTAALAVIKGSKLHWGSIGDSRVMIHDKYGKVKFKSRDQVAPVEEKVAAMVKHPKPQEKKLLQHKSFRNKVAPNKELLGYGVISGEKEALYYVMSGSIDLEKGDQVFIYTDGFEPYFELNEFRRLFQQWPTKETVKKFIKNFRKTHMPTGTQQDNLYKFLYKYTAEGSLIAIKID